MLNTLVYVIDQGLRLLHPIMPFVTEELWQRLPRRPGDPESICIATFPRFDGAWHNPTLEAQCNLAFDIVHGLRAIRADWHMKPSARPRTLIFCSSPASRATVDAMRMTIGTLSQSGEVAVLERPPEFVAECGTQVINDSVTGYIHLRGEIDVDAELARLNKNRVTAMKTRDGIAKKMAVPSYEAKVPEAVRRQDRERMDAAVKEIDNIEAVIKHFEALRH